MSDAQEKQHLEESINQILNDAYSDLIKLEYLDTAKVEEITEIIIASLVKPRIMRIHKDQLQLFDPSAYNYEGSD
jgi:hypothetical protein